MKKYITYVVAVLLLTTSYVVSADTWKGVAGRWEYLTYIGAMQATSYITRNNAPEFSRNVRNIQWVYENLTDEQRKDLIEINKEKGKTND